MPRDGHAEPYGRPRATGPPHGERGRSPRRRATARPRPKAAFPSKGGRACRGTRHRARWFRHRAEPSELVRRGRPNGVAGLKSPWRPTNRCRPGGGLCVVGARRGGPAGPVPGGGMWHVRTAESTDRGGPRRGAPTGRACGVPRHPVRPAAGRAAALPGARPGRGMGRDEAGDRVRPRRPAGGADGREFDRGRLAHAQRQHPGSGSGGGRAARTGVVSRRRLHRGGLQRSDVRPRGPDRRGPGRRERQLPGRGGGFPTRRGRPGQPRVSRPDRGPGMGAAQHRRLRRRPRAGHGGGPVRRRGVDLGPADDGAGARAVPPGHRALGAGIAVHPRAGTRGRRRARGPGRYGA